MLGLRGRGGRAALKALRQYLANRDLLLVLDNCEHVLDECAQLAATLLDSCPQVRILATSREPLAVNGETVWRLDPLGQRASVPNNIGNRHADWGDLFWPSPVFLPDGRGFSFGKDGLLELRVTTP